MIYLHFLFMLKKCLMIYLRVDLQIPTENIKLGFIFVKLCAVDEQVCLNL
jgi:hypothetical protein